MVSLQVLSLEARDASPCVVVTTDNLRLMFDVGEGTQRLALEHGVRLSKLEGIFLTRLSSETVCGLPGMVLTVADVGRSGFLVHGPHGIADFWKSTRFFMRRPNFNMDLRECPVPAKSSTSKGSEGGQSSNGSSKKEKRGFDDQAKSPFFTSFMGGEIGVHSLPFATDENSSHICYVCETPTMPGKFDVQRAKALGLKPGPAYGVLKAGKRVTMDDGTVIEPSQVLEPPVPGRFFAVICNASAPDDGDNSLLTRIAQDEYWRLFKRESGVRAGQLDCVVHLSPQSVVSQPTYREWMHSLGTDATSHLMVGAGCCSGETSFIAATRYCNKLNALCPEMFCKLDAENTTETPAPAHDGAASTAMEVEGSNRVQEVRCRPLQSFVCVPTRRRGLVDAPSHDLSEEVQQWWGQLLSREASGAELRRVFDRKEFVQSLSQGQVVAEDSPSDHEEQAGMYDLHCEQAKLLRGAFADHRLWVLGTGSAVPSKYRNVTGMLVQIPGKACQLDSGHGSSGALMVLDAGEGTWQQMVRMAHHHPALLSNDGAAAAESISAAHALAARVRVVWISHPHADHHLGITRILAECKRLRGSSFQPIVVIAPVAVLLYLREYASADPSVQGTYVAVTTNSLEPSSIAAQATARGGAEGAGSTYHVDDNAAIEKTSLSPDKSTSAGGNSSWYGSDQAHLGVDLDRAQAVWESLGVSNIANTRVTHCSQAYGVRVTLSSSPANDANSGDKSDHGSEITVVYSGDTRPCDDLVALGQGATFLIHEATFGNDKQEEAESKRHSTIGEAMDVARRMGAYRTLLTHFSQRYPSAPPIQSDEGSDTATVPPILAFDFMHLAFRDLLWAPVVTSALPIAFPAEEEDEEEENELAAAATATTATGPEGEGKSPGGSAPAVNMAVPGAFAMHPLCKGKGPCNCFDFPDYNEEEEDGGVMKASDKARRKRKAALLERGRQKSRGSRL